MYEKSVTVIWADDEFTRRVEAWSRLYPLTVVDRRETPYREVTATMPWLTGGTLSRQKWVLSVLLAVVVTMQLRDLAGLIGGDYIVSTPNALAVCLIVCGLILLANIRWMRDAPQTHDIMIRVALLHEAEGTATLRMTATLPLPSIKEAMTTLALATA